MTQLALGALLGATATVLTLAAWRRLTRRPHCPWCATASNWATSQHDALHCRGYVQERRRERLRDIAHGRPAPESNPWDNAHLLDEELGTEPRTPTT
ncbi:hypothetical protein CTZ27_31505 [Streptomyces griseocarneus]|nr:hypothetical protein CTZ27_31505 [Streptomyces griseocarneus]